MCGWHTIFTIKHSDNSNWENKGFNVITTILSVIYSIKPPKGKLNTFDGWFCSLCRLCACVIVFFCCFCFRCSFHNCSLFPLDFWLFLRLCWRYSLWFFLFIIIIIIIIGHCLIGMHRVYFTMCTCIECATFFGQRFCCWSQQLILIIIFVLLSLCFSSFWHMHFDSFGHFVSFPSLIEFQAMHISLYPTLIPLGWRKSLEQVFPL